MPDGVEQKFGTGNPERATKLSELEIGRKDQRDRIVIDILWSVHDFAVFKTDAGISPFFSDDETIAGAQRKNYLALGKEIAHFNFLIQLLQSETSNESSKLQTQFERELARGIATALTGDSVSARESILDVRKRLETILSNRARKTQFNMNISVFLGFLLCFAAVLLAESWIDAFSTGGETLKLGIAFVTGGFGALFSTAASLRSLRVDPTVSTTMHVVFGFQRMLIGSASAVALYIGYRSGVLSGLLLPTPDVETLTKVEYSNYWIAFVSLLAGFSERLVPNLLEAKADDEMEKAGGDKPENKGAQPKGG